MIRRSTSHALRANKTRASEAKKSGVSVVGASVMDLICYVPRLPSLGETLHGTDFKSGFGGKGANQAVAAAKLGADVSIVSRVGADLNGAATLENFKMHGVCAERVEKDCGGGAPTGVAPISVDADGNNSIVVVMAANDSLTVDHVEAARPEIAASRILLTQLELPAECTVAALRIGREEGTTTVLNTAPAKPLSELPADIFYYADIVCPNVPELELLTGRAVGSIATASEARLAAEELMGDHAGIQHVIVTRGSDGVLVLSSSSSSSSSFIPSCKTDVDGGSDGSKIGARPSCILIAPTADQPVDTVGAGDAFLGAFGHFYSLLQKEEEEEEEAKAATDAEAAEYCHGGGIVIEACRRANIVAGVSVTRQGTQTSYPSREELRGLDLGL